MRLLFLNQYFAPDPAPTGILFREIADYMAYIGHEVDFVDSGQAYRETQGKGGRMKRELAALRRMHSNGNSRPRADVVISGTSPPCLAVVADRVARRHRARHFHWAMDVYPEIAIELGELRRSSLIGKIAGWMIGRSYRRCARVIALDADMAVRMRRHGIAPAIIRPWVFKAILDQPTEEIAPDATWTWIYSGNLGRAHEWDTLLRAQQILEQRGVDARLLFQGGGPSFPAAKSRATELGLRHCQFRDYVAETELRTSLLQCRVLAVTQVTSVQGLLWPSKLGLVMTLPRPILFIGPPDGAIAVDLRRFPHAGIFSPGNAEEVAAWITAQREHTLPITRSLDARAHRDESLAAWRSLIEG